MFRRERPPFVSTTGRPTKYTLQSVRLDNNILCLLQTSSALTAFATRGTYVRYLRARNWNIKKATSMLKDSLQWRLEMKPHELCWENICHEGKRGKLFMLEKPDKEGRPVVLMRPRNEEAYSGDSEERIKWLVYTLEQASRHADKHSPDGKMTWLIDFVGNTRKNSPPISVSLRTLHILQYHYPERLGRAVSYKPPLIFEITWKAVSPFIDPVTYKKLVFLRHKTPEDAYTAMEEHFDMDHIDETLGGKIALESLWSFELYGEKMKMMDEEHRRLISMSGQAARP